MKERLYLGVDLGGTKVAAGVVSSGGEVRAMATVATPARQGPDRVIRAMAKAARQAARQAKVSVKALAGGGVGAPGPVDPDAGTVVAPPNLPGWQDVPVAARLGRSLGLPLALDNDANVAGLAEQRFGAGRGCSPMIYLTVSTGIGGALVLDGQLVAGKSGVAGEVGHMVLVPDGPLCGCGNRGCFEALASGTALAKRAREAVRQGAQSALTDRFGGRPSRITARDVAEAAEAGDAEARRLLDENLSHLGRGVANLVSVLNPERVVIGGGLSALGDTLLVPVRRSVTRLVNGPAARAVSVEAAELGPQAGVIGAAALAM